jgi:inosine/xanthosine triphosphatase
VLRLSDVRHIVVGSTNPVKIDAVRAVLGSLAPHAWIEGVAVPSGVSDQPYGDDETIRGARARAIGALDIASAELAVGIEGGVVEGEAGALRTCAWAVVVARDGREGVGGSLVISLPPSVVEGIRGGLELGAAMDHVTGQRDTKRGSGAVGILTGGLVDRQRAYEVLVSYALAPFLAPEYWPRPTAAPAESLPAGETP